jgi:hypothetical protein
MTAKMKAAAAKPGMSDEAVKARTGKRWAEWFAALDKAGARDLTHRAITEFLLKRFGVSDWWCQMVTVEYERARGLRDKYQSGGSYRVSACKTFAADLSKLYRAAVDARTRKKWFPEGQFAPSSQTENKYLRGSWNGDRRIEMGFYEKGAGKSQLALQVNRLAEPEEVEAVRAVWKDALARLENLLGK